MNEQPSAIVVVRILCSVQSAALYDDGVHSLQRTYLCSYIYYGMHSLQCAVSEVPYTGDVILRSVQSAALYGDGVHSPQCAVSAALYGGLRLSLAPPAVLQVSV